MKDQSPVSISRNGLVLALGTYAFWGAFPLYFKLLDQVPPAEILMHRVVWSFVFTLMLVSVLGLWPTVRTAILNLRYLGYFLLSAVLIAANWLLFVYGVFMGEVAELSLAYYINPMLNVCFGVLFFKERLNRANKLAVVLVVSGLCLQFIELAQFPVLALTIALVFSLYGVVRKMAPVDSVSGLFIETAILLPIALGYLVMVGRESSLAMMQESWNWALLLVLAGPLTSIPLITFAMAVKRIPYYLVGFCQYITPTTFLLMAVLLFGESISRLDLATFGLVWLGIGFNAGQSIWSNIRRTKA